MATLAFAAYVEQRRAPFEAWGRSQALLTCQFPVSRDKGPTTHTNGANVYLESFFIPEYVYGCSFGALEHVLGAIASHVCLCALGTSNPVLAWSS